MKLPEGRNAAAAVAPPATPPDVTRRSRRLPLYFLALAAGSYTLDVLLMTLFAALGTVPFILPLLGAAAAMVVCGVMYLLIRYRSQGREHDPYFQVIQVSSATVIQLAGLYFFPEVGFFFLNVLFIIFAFNALQLTLHELALRWFVVAVANALVLWAAETGPMIPNANPQERALVMVCYLLTLARCGYLGYISSQLRNRVEGINQKYRSLNAELEQRVAERTRELQQANDDLTEAARQLQSFAYSVAHDFRQPIIALNGYTGLLQRKLAGSDMEDAALDYVQRVQGATRRMESLTDGLIDLARVNRAELQRRTVDLSMIAHRVLEAYQRAEPQRPVQIEIQPGLRADADGALARVALEALLSNAWKFTAAASPAQIRVYAREHDGRTEYFVEDNGVGFEQAYADKLFGIFQRLHTERDYPGSGIGLAIAERVVRRHGGNIRAEGAEGRGATFRFTLGASQADGS
jgi:signal transduction histidine kinase